VTLSERARSALVDRPRSWYLDLGLIADYLGSGRRYHHTAPVAMVFALHAGLGVLLEEGLEASWRRHHECGTLLQEGLEKLGFTLFAEEGHRLPQLTAAWLPEGTDDRATRRALLERFGVEVGGGVGDYAGTTWRVGCMAQGARPRAVSLLLAALEELLGGR
jgi:alanine-glyoxylate transaminase/serine-glyoxylate transaminase/serine-pyruvate transaminase